MTLLQIKEKFETKHKITFTKNTSDLWTFSQETEEKETTYYLHEFAKSITLTYDVYIFLKRQTLSYSQEVSNKIDLDIFDERVEKLNQLAKTFL